MSMDEWFQATVEILARRGHRITFVKKEHLIVASVALEGGSLIGEAEDDACEALIRALLVPKKSEDTQ